MKPMSTARPRNRRAPCAAPRPRYADSGRGSHGSPAPPAVCHRTWPAWRDSRAPCRNRRENRNPDAKWKLSPEFIDEVKGVQQSILTDYATMLKPGGELVYSTCSILPSENQQQVQKFLNAHNGKFTLLDEQHYWPSEGFDGFYMARIGLGT